MLVLVQSAGAGSGVSAGSGVGAGVGAGAGVLKAPKTGPTPRSLRAAPSDPATAGWVGRSPCHRDLAGVDLELRRINAEDRRGQYEQVEACRSTY